MIFIILATIIAVSRGTAPTPCSSPSTVDDVTSQDTPAFVSGSVSSDVLSLSFRWHYYGSESSITYDSTSGAPIVGGTTWHRYVDSSNTGFVKVATPADGPCTSHDMAVNIAAASGVITGIITYNNGLDDTNCYDSITQAVPWSTTKTDCGSAYFQSSGGTNGDPYVVSFVYRVTYIEQLSSGDSRVVSNDYSFKVTSPTEFTIDSSTFELAGVATQVSQQVVKVESTGKTTLTIQAIATCDAVLSSVTVTSQTSLTAGTPAISSSGAPGTVYGVGTKYAGLCPFTWTIDITPSGGCSISGNFHVTYGITPTGGTLFTTPEQTILVSSSDTCSVTAVSGSDWTAGDFTMQLRTAADGQGNVLAGQTVVNYGQTAHWEIVASKSTSDVPKPTQFSISALQVKIGSGSFTSISSLPDGASSTLALSTNDGGTTGVKTSGTSTDYSLYWSHLWETADFPSSGTLTSIQVRVTFDLVYPTISRSDGKRVFRVLRNAGFSLLSPKFSLTTDTTTTSSERMGLIVGLSVTGALIVVGICCAVILLVFWRRKRNETKNNIITRSSKISNQRPPLGVKVLFGFVLKTMVLLQKIFMLYILRHLEGDDASPSVDATHDVHQVVDKTEEIC